MFTVFLNQIMNALLLSIGIVMNFDEDTAGLTLVWINLAQAVLLFAAIILTEVGLHKRFDKYGNPK